MWNIILLSPFLGQASWPHVTISYGQSPQKSRRSRLQSWTKSPCNGCKQCWGQELLMLRNWQCSVCLLHEEDAPSPRGLTKPPSLQCLAQGLKAHDMEQPVMTDDAWTPAYAYAAFSAIGKMERNPEKKNKQT